MSRVFLNYRRSEDGGFTQALYLTLERELSIDSVFMDIEGQIGPGDDFVSKIEEQVRRCSVLLAIIGPRWLEALLARAANPDDFVKLEIQTALDQGKKVIPVLVGGASMPAASALPESIRALARRNAVHVRPERFPADSKALSEHLAEVLAAPEVTFPINPPRRKTFGGKTFTHRFSVPAGTLRRGLRRTLFAMSAEEERFYLNGFCWHPGHDLAGNPTVNMVATDGHRLAVVQMADEAGLSGMPRVIVHRDTAYELYTLLDATNSDVQVAVSTSRALFSVDEITLDVALIDGIFPSYERVIPRETRSIARFNSRRASDAIESLVSASGRSRVRMSMSAIDGDISFSVAKKNNDLLSMRLAPMMLKDFQPVSFNARYILDVLRRIDAEEVEMSFADPDGPTMFREVGVTDAFWIVMPLRV